MASLLFLSGVGEGGSFLSTRALCHQLAGRGHEITLAYAGSCGRVASYVYRRGTNLAAKAAGRPAGGLIERACRRIASRARLVEDRGLPMFECPIVENAGRALLRERPDVVVASSVSRVAWRRIHADASRYQTPSILYLREDALIEHLQLDISPTALVANSSPLVDAAQVAGYECELVPSVVDVERSRIESTREVVLVVNPSLRYGSTLAAEITARNPLRRFVYQESFPLDEESQHVLTRILTSAENAEYRPFASDPSSIYRDARLLLAPYPVELSSARPRVVLEAQANGIPVVATALPGLTESVGAGGLLVAAGDDLSAWSSAIEECWDDDAYAGLCAAALDHASRPDVDPEFIVDKFESVIAGIVG